MKKRAATPLHNELVLGGDHSLISDFRESNKSGYKEIAKTQTLLLTPGKYRGGNGRSWV